MTLPSHQVNTLKVFLALQEKDQLFITIVLKCTTTINNNTTVTKLLPDHACDVRVFEKSSHKNTQSRQMMSHLFLQPF